MLHKPLTFIIFILVFVLISQSESIAQKSIAKKENLSSPRNLKATARIYCNRKWKIRRVNADESDKSAAYLHMFSVARGGFFLIRFSNTHPDFKKLMNLTPEDIFEFVCTSTDQDHKWRTTDNARSEYTRYLRLKLKKD